MVKSTFFVAKKNDADLFDFFCHAAKTIGSENITVLVSGASSSKQLPIEASDSNEELNWIRNSTTKSISSITASSRGFRIHIDRRPEINKENHIDLSMFDPLVLDTGESRSGDGGRLEPEEIQSLNELIHRQFGDDASLASAAFKDPKSFQTVLRSHQSIIERLQQMTLEVGEQASRTRKALDAEYLELKKQLEEQTAEQRLESQKAIDGERALLAQRSDEIEARSKALDDRDNTHVRRELHEKLKARLADRFKKLDLTPQTRRARWPIHIGVVISAVILAILIYTFTIEALAVISRGNSTVAERVLVIVKSATASLGFLGIISWYLRWMNRWFERLADSEFHLKQFELDITRAQWVVETAFEWKMSQQSPIPDQLLENVSRNLFLGPEKDAGADMHPADYLASALIGKASNVKLAVPGAEIELGPKALRGATG